MKKGFRLNYKVSWWENGPVIKKKSMSNAKITEQRLKRWYLNKT